LRRLAKRASFTRGALVSAIVPVANLLMWKPASTESEAVAPAVLAAPRNTDVSLRHARTRAVAERC